MSIPSFCQKPVVQFFSTLVTRLIDNISMSSCTKSEKLFKLLVHVVQRLFETLNFPDVSDVLLDNQGHAISELRQLEPSAI